MARSAQKRRTPPPKKRKFPVLPVVIGLVVVAAIVALLLAGGSDTSQVADVTVSGVALARLPEQGGDPAVGQPAPEVTGISFDGTSVAIVNDGRPKALIFLAHW